MAEVCRKEKLIRHKPPRHDLHFLSRRFDEAIVGLLVSSNLQPLASNRSPNIRVIALERRARLFRCRSLMLHSFLFGLSSKVIGDLLP